MDTENLRLCYEGIVKQNPNNIDAIYFLAVWHLERNNFDQARKYFAHLASLQSNDPDVWLSLCVACALANEYTESLAALNKAKTLVKTSDTDVRVKFCQALLAEKRKDYPAAMDGYTACLNSSNALTQPQASNSLPHPREMDKNQKLIFMKEIRGEVMLRIALLKKETGYIEQAMQMCNTITSDTFSESIRANALCLKGILHEMKAEFPPAEVVYRSVLQIRGNHSLALERLGRVYLRYRETIPAAVQCFFKAVETNPSNHTAWYLLGRCYMATLQYPDACEAYNRAINLNPNDPQIWCSLGVLYYSFGQYREALGMLTRALKLDPTMGDAWYNVGALYDMCDQPDDAQQAYLKAKENGIDDLFSKAGMTNPLSSTIQMSAANPNQAAVAAAAVASAQRQHQLQQQQHQQHQQQHNIPPSNHNFRLQPSQQLTTNPLIPTSSPNITSQNHGYGYQNNNYTQYQSLSQSNQHQQLMQEIQLQNQIQSTNGLNNTGTFSILSNSNHSLENTLSNNDLSKKDK